MPFWLHGITAEIDNEKKNVKYKGDEAIIFFQEKYFKPQLALLRVL